MWHHALDHSIHYLIMHRDRSHLWIQIKNFVENSIKLFPNLVDYKILLSLKYYKSSMMLVRRIVTTSKPIVIAVLAAWCTVIIPTSQLSMVYCDGLLYEMEFVFLHTKVFNSRTPIRILVQDNIILISFAFYVELITWLMNFTNFFLDSCRSTS